MNSFINKNKDQWGDNPESLMSEYSYNQSLTKKLDTIKTDDFNRELLYEIVLWKLDRFPQISDDLIEKIKGLGSLKNGEHRQSENFLAELLMCRGVALPMASTILRFVNPNVFQIIDDRAFRALYGPNKKKYPTKPLKVTSSYLKISIEIYFEYIDTLLEVCCIKLPFKNADRILYVLDKKQNHKIGDKQ